MDHLQAFSGERPVSGDGESNWPLCPVINTWDFIPISMDLPILKEDIMKRPFAISGIFHVFSCSARSIVEENTNHESVPDRVRLKIGKADRLFRVGPAFIDGLRDPADRCGFLTDRAAAPVDGPGERRLCFPAGKNVLDASIRHEPNQCNQDVQALGNPGRPERRRNGNEVDQGR